MLKVRCATLVGVVSRGGCVQWSLETLRLSESAGVSVPESFRLYRPFRPARTGGSYPRAPAVACVGSRCKLCRLDEAGRVIGRVGSVVRNDYASATARKAHALAESSAQPSERSTDPRTPHGHPTDTRRRWTHVSGAAGVRHARTRVSRSEPIPRRHTLLPRHLYLGDVYLPWECARQLDSLPWPFLACVLLSC